MQPDRVLTKPFVLTVLAEFATCMSIGMLLVILPVYVNDDLGAGSFGVALAIGAVSPMILLSQPIAGRIGDRKGRRILVVAGALIAAVSVAAYSFAGSLELLIAFRLFTGLGEAMVLVGAATIVTDLAPENRRGEALSLYSLGLWGGLALGPILGELVLGTDRFTEVWLLAAGFCIVSAAIGTLLPETTPERAVGEARHAHEDHPSGRGRARARPRSHRVRIRGTRHVRGAVRARARDGRRGRGLPRLLDGRRRHADRRAPGARPPRSRNEPRARRCS